MEQKFELTPGDRNTPLWMKLEVEMKRRLASQREKNDARLSVEDTAHARGRIAELKDLLALGKDQSPGPL